MRRRAPEDWAGVELSYPEVGATQRDPLPAGYGLVERDVVVGRGEAAFSRAAEGLMTWGMHRGAGLAVEALGDVRVGAVVVLHLRPLPVLIPCRVVHAVRNDRETGFAYGTLPGHPEQGEESFVLVRSEHDDVRFRIRAFSRPATFLARAGGPLTRVVQAKVTDRYVEAVRRLAR